MSKPIAASFVRKRKRSPFATETASAVCLACEISKQSTSGPKNQLPFRVGIRERRMVQILEARRSIVQVDPGSPEQPLFLLHAGIVELGKRCNLVIVTAGDATVERYRWEPHPAGDLLPAKRSLTADRHLCRSLQSPALPREPAESYPGRCLLRARPDHSETTRKDQTEDHRNATLASTQIRHIIKPTR